MSEKTDEVVECILYINIRVTQETPYRRWAGRINVSLVSVSSGNEITSLIQENICFKNKNLSPSPLKK